MKDNDILKLIRNIPLFASLEIKQLNELAEVSRILEYRSGEIVFQEGDDGDALYLICSGVVKITSVSLDGHEKILAFLFAGDVLGEMSILDGLPRSATAQCMEDCRFLVISRNDATKILSGDPELAKRILQVLARRLRDADRHLVELSYLGARDRLYGVLQNLAQEKGEHIGDGWILDIKLTHEEIGSYLGISRETVTRLMRLLADEEFIDYRNNRIIVLDK